MSYYAIIRIEKRQIGSCAAIEKHHERKKEQYKSNPNIDPALTPLNYHLVQPTKSYRMTALERIEEVGAKRRKDSVILQDGLLTASPEWIRDKSPQEQTEFFNYAYEFLKERYKEENFVSAVVHLDEATPHMHFVFVPITEDGRLSSKDVMGGPKGMAKLQDDFYEYMIRKYPELARGIPARVSHRTHLPSYLYKNAAELYKHYDEIQSAIKDIGLVGNAKKKDEAIALLGRYAPEMARMEEQLKITDRHVDTLEQEIRTRNSIINIYASKNSDQAEEIEKLKDNIYELQTQQRELVHIIKMIPPDLLEDMMTKERERRKHERNKGWSR
jgi:hypothetical protein